MADQTKKKHHYVPQFLLRNFADEREGLLVVRTDADRDYRSTVRDVGQENNGHTLYWPNREPDSNSLEDAMSRLEAVASVAVNELRASAATRLTAQQRETLGFFLALQWSRSRFLLAVVRRAVDEELPVQDRTAKSTGLLSILMNVLAPWEARQRGAFDPKEVFCSTYAMIAGWSWRVFRPRGAKLVVGDTTVCMSGIAPGATALMSEPWTRHGVGVGFGTCARITAPLAPDLGLVLVPPSVAEQRMTAVEFNRATVWNSRGFVAYRPDWAPDRRIEWGLADAVRTQRQMLPTILAGSRV